jgi:outer membrane protein assembly factor BamB
MGDQPSAAVGDGQSGPGRTDDPMSADRRVLTIAVASMVGLVLLGVVSAQLFTRSACTRIDPDLVAARSVGTAVPALLDQGVTEVGVVLAEAFPDLDEASLVGALAVLEDELGPLLAAADVGDADRLAIVDGEVAALGSVTTVLTGDGTEVRATADVDEGTVVGSGSTLYSLALVNPLTGQVDAIQPLDADLGAGTCVDTATVGTPLAFHLDAGDGELLLLRTEEDGDEPAVELRDATTGSVWSTGLEVGTAPAGVLADRVTGQLGAEDVVVGWRTLADHDGDAVAALDRATGEVRWTVPADSLREVADAGEQPLWVEVLAVGDDEAVVALVPEGDAETAWPGHVAALDLADGEVRWAVAPDGDRPTLAVPTASGWAVATVDGDGLTVHVVEAGEVASASTLTAGDGEPRGAQLPDGATVIAAGPLVVLEEEADDGADRDAHGIDTDLRAIDVAAAEDRVHLLLASDEGAVVLTFSGPHDLG